MLSLSATQPEFVLSVGQLASAWSTLRSLSHTAARTRHKYHGMATTIDEYTDEVDELLHEWGLDDICQHMAIETLHPILNPGAQHFTTSYVSTDSFFTNKHGISESKILSQGSRGQHTCSGIHRRDTALLTRWLPQSFYQQCRGFITKHQPPRQNHGLGQNTGPPSPRLDEPIQDHRSPGFSRGNMAWPTEKPEVPVVALVNDFMKGQNEEVQTKILASFSEGYMVGHGGSPKPSGKFPRLRWLLKGTAVVGLVSFIVLVLPNLKTIVDSFSNSRIHGVISDITHMAQPMEVEETLDDVKGCDEVKEELKHIVDFLRNPEKFTALGAKHPKGVLLVGPPGTGKTMLARAVAGEADVPFLYASGADFDEMFVGVGAKRIRELFADAKQRAPCVIFLDELDAVGGKRTNSDFHPYANQTINQLLTEMDGFKQNQGIIVLGATNRKDHLDTALRRAGRFDIEISVRLPDYNGRLDLFDLYLNKIKAASNINIDHLARKTVGFSGADIANMVNQGAILAALDNDPLVEMSHLELARDKIIMGPMRKTRIPDEETNRVTAYHESGHAIIAYFTKDVESPHKVTIMPRGDTLGHMEKNPEKDQYNSTRSQLLAEMDVAFGGRVAEEMIFGKDKITSGASNDFEKATYIAELMVKRLGMSERVGQRIIEDKDSPHCSPATLELADLEIKRLLQESYDRCKLLMNKKNKELKDLAEFLLKYDTLNEDEILTILEGKEFIKAPSRMYNTETLPQPAHSNNKTIKTILGGTKLPREAGIPHEPKLPREGGNTSSQDT